MSSQDGQKLVPAVQNAMTIMRLLSAAGAPMGATQIARETGLNVSSAFNILRTLNHGGLLSFDPEAKTYTIGMGLMEFAAPLLGANPSDLIRPTLTAIAQEHRVAVALWQITANERIVLIDRFSAPNIVQAVMARSSRLPVFAGAIGRVYAAALELTEAQTRAGYENVRWQNAPGFDTYWQDVQAARESGTAKDPGNLFRGLDIVAAMALDATHVPRLGMSSITITGQQTDESLDQVGAALADAARQIERGVFGRTSKD
ncbi:transcriptional repressor IclR [Marinovum algicola]|uniref:Transcriptional regulator, IclR family n=1 Tax=Marinovum algicola TaxID=42444 RepID=A0A975WEV4_9RHOB|nr:helix-turn-helix domain-containing protein [Marinovum algicola]SEK08997.1 transcriptional regulator, IclR family [Marinovum algicola]SLN71837.1 transcriptional repressor IclR [Marinovum algicola]